MLPYGGRKLLRTRDPSLAIAVLTTREFLRKSQLDVELAEPSRFRVVRGLRIQGLGLSPHPEP